MVAAFFGRGGELTMVFDRYLEGGCHEKTLLDGFRGGLGLDGLKPGKSGAIRGD